MVPLDHICRHYYAEKGFSILTRQGIQNDVRELECAGSWEDSSCDGNATPSLKLPLSEFDLIAVKLYHIRRTHL